mmetsp:Transcript_89797/g.159682  ORF Transcript_89797/g.159682 Transcript_89797/m.159682 type:complete len:212 (-) Transcript_89797:64-699(-)
MLVQLCVRCNSQFQPCPQYLQSFSSRGDLLVCQALHAEASTRDFLELKILKLWPQEIPDLFAVHLEEAALNSHRLTLSLAMLSYGDVVQNLLDCSRHETFEVRRAAAVRSKHTECLSRASRPISQNCAVIARQNVFHDGSTHIFVDFTLAGIFTEGPVKLKALHQVCRLYGSTGLDPEGRTLLGPLNVRDWRSESSHDPHRADLPVAYTRR